MVMVACPRCKNPVEKVAGPMVCPKCGYGGKASNVPPPPPPPEPTQSGWVPVEPSVPTMNSDFGSQDAGKYPADLTGQLGQGEKVQFFSYLAIKGGCLGMGGTTTRYWIAMTDRRVMYSAMVQEQQKTINRDGMVPFAKVSHVEVAEIKQAGCMGGKTYVLKIGSSGGEVHIPITTREKGLEVRNAYARLSHSGA